jgi:hypothetical protein
MDGDGMNCKFVERVIMAYPSVSQLLYHKVSLGVLLNFEFICFTHLTVVPKVW